MCSFASYTQSCLNGKWVDYICLHVHLGLYGLPILFRNKNVGANELILRQLNFILGLKKWEEGSVGQ